MAPRVGLRFLHKYWTDNQGQPLVYEVTAIRRGSAYIRLLGENKAKESVSLDRWPQVFGSPHDQDSPSWVCRVCSNSPSFAVHYPGHGVGPCHICHPEDFQMFLESVNEAADRDSHSLPLWTGC